MKGKRKRKNRREYCRIAIHTSPDTCKCSIQQMETLINNSLRDAFLPRIIHVSATAEKADEHYNDTVNDPYWQSKYKALSESEVVNRYRGLLPIANQFQMDSNTFVSCVKVREPIDFEQVLHYEPETDPSHGSKTGEVCGFDASDLFFGLTSEKDSPAMRSWDDIPWNSIGVVPKDIFYRFIKILLRRLAVILFKKWKTQEGSCLASGYDQDIVQGTYFDVIKGSRNAQNVIYSGNP